MHYSSLFVVFPICVGGPEDNNYYYKSDTII